MKKRIFISTDANLHGIFGGRTEADLQQKLNNSGLSLLKDNDVVYYNEKTFDTITTTSSIIVVNDLSATRLEGINADTDFLLHHTQTDEHITNVVNKFEGNGNKVQGQHPDLYYTDVFKIIFDDTNTDKLNSILKVLGFTEEEIKKKDDLEALIHLHKSLNLLPLKIKAGILKDNDFKTEIDKIKAKEEMKLSVEKFLPNGETVTPDTLEAKLTAIEDEIVKLSTTR